MTTTRCIVGNRLRDPSVNFKASIQKHPQHPTRQKSTGVTSNQAPGYTSKGFNNKRRHAVASSFTNQQPTKQDLRVISDNNQNHQSCICKCRNIERAFETSNIAPTNLHTVKGNLPLSYRDIVVDSLQKQTNIRAPQQQQQSENSRLISEPTRFNTIDSIPQQLINFNQPIEYNPDQALFEATNKNRLYNRVS